MTVIIFGASGQDGHYVKEACAAKGYRVISVSRSQGDWISGDVGNFDFVKTLIADNKPDIIFHLAAVSTTRHTAIFENHRAVADGTLNILEAVKQKSPNTKVFITGSGVQFKNHGHAIVETDEFEASSSYSASRIYSVYLGRYFRTLGLKVYVGYLFHHESPMRKSGHVSMMIVNAVTSVARKGPSNLELGNIDVRKEWAYAGDIANGMLTLVQQDRVYEACIGTGVAYSIREWLALCFAEIGKNWIDYVTIKDGFTPEYTLLVSDPRTINSIGWKPEVSIEKLAKILLDSSLK